jgi:hypothetical protein
MVYNMIINLKKGQDMLYKLFSNYIRLKFIRMLLNIVMKSKIVKTKNIKTMNLMTYGLELLATLYFNRKRKMK